MCELHFKFQEDQTKTAVAIERIGTSNRRTDSQTDRQTDTQVILYLYNAMHSTEQTKHTTNVYARLEKTVENKDQHMN